MVDPRPRQTGRVIPSAFWGCCLLLLAFDLWWIGRALPASLFGDEWRYLYYAENLIRGFYSPTERVFLWNGPGYPLVLVPFVKVGWVDGARYANAVFHVGAIAYAWLVLRPRLPPVWAFAASLALALYLPIYDFQRLLYTEVLCFFLVTSWTYHSLRASTSRAHTVLAGCLLGFLCLTKVIFGYALFALWLGSSLLWWRSRRPVLGAYVRQTALAVLLCLPYLVYTHQLTGRLFYWSTSGPDSFYWLTSPSPHEWGEWYHQGWVNNNPNLRAYHKPLFDRLSGVDQNPGLSGQERLFNLCTPESGDVFLQRARENVRQHPGKFARNWLANVARLFVDVPQPTRGVKFWNRYTAPHLGWLGFGLFVSVYAWRRRRWPADPWRPLAGFAALTFGLLTLSSGMARFLVPLVPLGWLFACCWLAEATSRPPISR